MFVATFARKVNLEIPKFFNRFIALPKLASGQLPFLGLSASAVWCAAFSAADFAWSNSFMTIS